jgi:hypothetical protein
MVIPPKIRWVTVDVGDSLVAFETECRLQGQAYSFQEKKCVTWDLKCTNLGFKHGHVLIGCDDGTAWIPFPCVSQEGVQRLLAGQKYIWDAEKTAILALDEIKALPVALTEDERAIFEDPERLKVFTTYGYAGI